MKKASSTKSPADQADQNGPQDADGERDREPQDAGEAAASGRPPREIDHAATLVENAPFAMAMFDKEMRYLVANRKWLDEFRLEQAEILGRTQFEVFPDLQDSWRDIYEHCLEGHAERCEEDILERDDGSRDWVRWEVRPWRQANFLVGGLIVTCEIVTPIKKAEQALKDDRDLADALMQGNSPVVILDATGHIIRHSRGALQLAAPGSVVGGALNGTLFTEAFPIDEDPDSFVGGLQNLIWGSSDKKTPADRVLSRARMTDGTSLEISWAFSPGIDEHGVLTQIVLTGIPRSLEPRHPPAAPPTVARESSAASSPRADPSLGNLSGLTRLGHPGTDREEPARREAPREERSGTGIGSPDPASLLVANNAPLGLILLDPEALILYANDQVGKLLGFALEPGDSIEEWLRKGCPEEHYAGEVVAEWRDNIRSRQLRRVLTLADTGHVLKEIEFRPSLLDDGNLLIAITDITESQRAEEALRASEYRLRRLFDDTPVAIALVDSSGYIFDANHALETLLGYSRLDLRKAPFDDLVATVDIERKRGLLEEMRRDDNPSATIDIKLRHSTGDLVPTRLHITETSTGDNRPAFASYLIVERSEENALAAKLLESQLQNRALLSASSKAVLLVDRESRRLLDMHLPADFPACPALEQLEDPEDDSLAAVHPEIDRQLSLLLETPEDPCPEPEPERGTRTGITRPLVLQGREGEAIHLETRVTSVDTRHVLLLLVPVDPARPGTTPEAGEPAGESAGGDSPDP